MSNSQILLPCEYTKMGTEDVNIELSPIVMLIILLLPSHARRVNMVAGEKHKHIPQNKMWWSYAEINCFFHISFFKKII